MLRAALGRAVSASRRGRRRIAVLALAWPAVAAAEPGLERLAVAAAVADADGGMVVVMAYELRPEGAAEVPLTGIAFEPAAIESVRAIWQDRELVLAVNGSAPPRLDVAVRLPEAAAARDVLSLEVVYEVRGAIRPKGRGLDVRLPLLVVGWPPPETRPGTFEAILELPPEAVVSSAFPSDVERVEPAAGDGGAVYRWTSPVVPALLRCRAAVGDGRILTFGRAADAVAVAVLAGLAVVGWRRFRRLLR